MRTQHEMAERGQSLWAFGTERHTHGQTDFAFQCSSWGDVHGVGLGRGVGGLGRELAGRVPTVLQGTRPSLSYHSNRCDISGNFHRRRTGGPQLPRWSRREGSGSAGMSSGEKAALEVAYQTWQDLAAVWFVGRATIRSHTLPSSHCLCALLLSAVGVNDSLCDVAGGKLISPTDIGFVF